MVVKVLVKNIHIDKKLQILFFKKYSNNFKYLIKNNLNYFFCKNNFISFPIKKNIYTVLASPHINKKAREQFALTKFIKGLQFNFNNYYNFKIYNYIFFYKNRILNSLLKNYYNNLYLKNTYNYVLVKKIKNHSKKISVSYNI